MMKTRKKMMALIGCALFVAVPMIGQEAWNDYSRRDSIVAYQGQVLAGADAATFRELGFGYAKDAYSVYYRGEVLEFVNPATFEVGAKFTRRHTIGDKKPISSAPQAAAATAEKRGDKKEKGARGLLSAIGLGAEESGHYEVNDGEVVYNGQTVKLADAATFEVLKAGYARDRRRAYYMGRVISGALGGAQFNYLGDDYATDGLHTYFKGKEVSRD